MVELERIELSPSRLKVERLTIRPPASWLWGQDSNLRINWLTASRLTTWLPHKKWSGTSDLNRDSLGPRPSGLIRFPSPRMSRIWCERLESNQRPRASDARAHIQLSYAHKTLEQAAGIEPAFLRKDRSVLSVERRPHNWGDRRELNPRRQIHSLPPKPLGHGHAWCQGHESNVLVRLFRPAP